MFAANEFVVCGIVAALAIFFALSDREGNLTRSREMHL
jgi:hypothetical protein